MSSTAPATGLAVAWAVVLTLLATLWVRSPFTSSGTVFLVWSGVALPLAAWTRTWLRRRGVRQVPTGRALTAAVGLAWLGAAILAWTGIGAETALDALILRRPLLRAAGRGLEWLPGLFALGLSVAGLAAALEARYRIAREETEETSTPAGAVALVLAALLLGLSGCGDGGTGPFPEATFREVGVGVFDARPMADLWLHGDHGYTGTRSRGPCAIGGTPDPCGDLMAVWDVSNPASPRLLDTLALEAAVVNDVKVSADGSLLVATHEGSPDGLNGISLFDLSDPGAPLRLTRYTDGLETGVHNVWIETLGGRDYVFVIVDGARSGAGLHVVDVSDRAAPRTVSTFYAGFSVAHDVYVRDGLAFLSHWDAGLIVLDVGNGIRGGSPEAPVEVSRIPTPGGNVHNAWYWPAGGYVFVGQEEGLLPEEEEVGSVHVVDFRDPEEPRVVGSVFAPESTPHNFWMDEEEAILFVGWYRAGLRAVDVSGTLEGRLERQGRVVAVEIPTGPLGPGDIWAPQLHRGHVWVSDRNNGLRSYTFHR